MGLFRVIAYLIASVLVISVVRAILGALMKGVGDLFRSSSDASSTTPARPSTEGMGGELKKDPVCGTFISPAAAFQKSVGGTTYYFCSVVCRDKFSG